jgi:hypothetical protein
LEILLSLKSAGDALVAINALLFSTQETDCQQNYGEGTKRRRRLRHERGRGEYCVGRKGKKMSNKENSR